MPSESRPERKRLLVVIVIYQIIAPTYGILMGKNIRRQIACHFGSSSSALCHGYFESRSGVGEGRFEEESPNLDCITESILFRKLFFYKIFFFINLEFFQIIFRRSAISNAGLVILIFFEPKLFLFKFEAFCRKYKKSRYYVYLTIYFKYSSHNIILNNQT